MYFGKVERRKNFERREEVNLKSSIFGEILRDELAQIDKHEIVVKICEILGSCPSNFHLAERIFEECKYEIAKYVIHHIYSKEDGIRSRLLLWLDSRTNPDKAEMLSDFMSKYLSK